MLRKIFPLLVILVLPVLAEHPSSLLAQTAPMPAAMPTAATSGLAVGVPKLPPIATPRNQQVIPVPEQPAPDLNTPSSQTAPFEHGASVLSLPGTFARQLSPTERVAPESIISQPYLGTRDDTVRGLSLKEAIYIGLANNPNVKVAELDPLGSEEAVEVANGAFDPALTAEGDIIKSVVPVTSPFQVSGSRAFTNKLYDWDFGLNKVSALTNGTIGLTFNNERAYSNSSFASINPSYVPQLALSVSQPLLRNFGWNFATLNVRIAESSQKQSQWNMEQSIEDFVLRIGTDYWNVVQAEENLQVAEYALRLNSDLVRQNRIALQVGTLAPIDLQEAQSAEATSAANVYTAQAAQRAARAALRQDVMMNPASTFVPQEIEPTDKPNPTREMIPNEEVALETAIQYRPSLEGMREAIRGALMQVKFSENQTLPQLNLGAQFGLNSTAGTSHCIRNFSGLTSGNCAATPLVPGSGTKLPFGGIYGDALNRLFGTSFYNYAAVLNFAYPIDNAAARSVLAQTRVQYESLRMQYRASISTAVVAVQTALANLEADHKRVQATRQATYFAAQSLHDEEIRFKVGMATTHDLLQFQEQLISAQGNQVQAEVDLEDARLSLEHEQGTLLRAFQIDFQLQDPHRSPWYSKF
ncbi:MAG TPA: TolC family protein [Candidatus Binataceae bacterium]|jgi:outer membrane protein TolC|nr:TolC family protein [Candidatus Binataceae bacterium]